MKQMTMKQTREALALLSIVDMMHVEGLAAGTVNENAARIAYKAQGGRPVRYIHISSRARKANLDAIAAAVAEAIGAERWAEIVAVVTGEQVEETTDPAEAAQAAPAAPQVDDITTTERYDYLEHMTADVIDAIRERYTPDEIRERLDDDRDDLAQDLDEDLWTDDAVTGNASGSYYCNAWRAEDAIAHNWDLIADMIDEFGGADILRKGPEAIDVSIRCYLLGQAIDAALDQLDGEIPAAEAPDEDDDTDDTDTADSIPA